jgi:hypothetical protein
MGLIGIAVFARHWDVMEEPADRENVATVVEKNARSGTHGQSFLVCGGNGQEGIGAHPSPDG